MARIYKIPRGTKVTVSKHGKWDSYTLTEDLVFENSQYKGINESVMHFYYKHKDYYIHTHYVIKL
jgi:hypothetical protein